MICRYKNASVVLLVNKIKSKMEPFLFFGLDPHRTTSHGPLESLNHSFRTTGHCLSVTWREKSKDR